MYKVLRTELWLMPLRPHGDRSDRGPGSLTIICVGSRPRRSAE
jgi:hypothetical protein